jgi:phosphate-selective porin
MRKLFLTLAATAAVLATGSLTTRSDAMTIDSGLRAAADTAGTVEQVRWYGRHFRYRYHRHHHHRRHHFHFRRYW